MNILELLENGQVTVLDAIDGLPESNWHGPYVAGNWSVKDIIGHLTSYEQVVIDLLNSLLGRNQPTPTLDSFRREYSLTFDELEVAKRRDKTVREVVAEYKAAQAQTVALLPKVPAEVRQRKGIAPWGGSPYDLEDFIIYTLYGHKQEHGAQIAAFRQNLARQPINRSTTTSIFPLNQISAQALPLKPNSDSRVQTPNGHQVVWAF